ncbi:Rho GTPase-activating protein 21 [Entomortierella chlamydospora]|uniref:Rho GTPase-activating protein 21 n=1 Tax=Entomortierella chlamydospora TaxID=101097 RepID=A0A9P6T1T5_9FUNG|nr:Rho GTPase-activating protein 21 [Entomortierella chlamydospora]KAG0018643.1 Rho GTPase-activating protein 21 [Entomortierella chlamydospora]
MQWAIAEWDYFATHEDELSFRKGDNILIQDSSHEEWWEGECNGLSGVFPANRCRLLESDQRDVSDLIADQPLHTQDTLDQSIGHDRTGYQNELEVDTTYKANIINQAHQQHPEHLSNIPDPSADHVDLARIQSPPPEPTDELSDSDQVLLPPNWSATTNAKGQLYYYNILTKETSWKFPSVAVVTFPTEATMQPPHHGLDNSDNNNSNNIEMLNDNQSYETEDAALPEGWSSAQDEDGTLYFFNSSTGVTTWDRPTFTEPQGSYVQPTVYSGSSAELDKAYEPMSPSTPSAASTRQPSVDEGMLQSQLLSLSLSEEELRVLELSQLPLENIQRRGSLRVKSQKISTNATISSWKEYWVVVYKGFLLLYRDEGGMIKNAHSLKSSVESMSRLKQATQVRPSGCFDAEKVAVELPANGQALTKKKNFFYITPGTNVRLLLQDASGGDERAWVKDIKTSLDSRKSDELSGSEEPYLIQVLRRQTSGGGEASGLKMNKKIEGKNHKSALKTDKTRGIRSMVAQGIHGPRRKSAQDEKLRLPTEEDIDTSYNDILAKPSGAAASTNRAFSTPRRKSSRDQSKDLTSPSSRKEYDANYPYPEAGHDISSPGNYTSNYGAKAKLSNMSRNFFSKDKDSKDKEREKEKEKEKEKERLKEKSKEKSREKFKDLKKEQVQGRIVQGGSQVFGGILSVEPGRTIPKVVELCVKTIEARGLSTAGIYRVSGHMASIQSLKKAFNEGSDVDRLIEKEPDVNTIAALLKLYFRELREPLMLFDFYPSFIAAADISEYNEKLYTIKSLVHSLPEPNFSTLQYLMMHLGHVQDQYQTTKMDSANLAICFAPNLLRQEVDDLTSIINTGKQSSIVDTLIEQREWIFDPYPEDDEGEEEALEGDGDANLEHQQYEQQQSEYNQSEPSESYQETQEGPYHDQMENETNHGLPPSYTEDDSTHHSTVNQQGDNKDSSHLS